jgi:hypothetical protein
MKKLSLAAALLLFTTATTPANAQNAAALCKLRASYRSDGSAAYQAGVDAKGNPVAPADVSPTARVLGSTIRIPVSKVLAGQLGLEAKADMGMVEIHDDGRVTLNGQDLTAKTDEVCAAKPEVKSEEKKADAAPAAATPNAPALESTKGDGAPVVEEGKVSMPVDAAVAPAAPAAPTDSAVVPMPAAPTPPPAMDLPAAPPAGEATVPAVPPAPNAFDDPSAAPVPPAPQTQVVPVSPPPAEAQPAADVPPPPAPPAVEPQAGDEPKAEKIIWRRPQ